MTALSDSFSSMSSPPVLNDLQSISRTNYLQRSIEDISLKTKNYHKMGKAFHLTIAYASGLLFVAAAVLGIVATAIFAPYATPVVGLLAISFSSHVEKFISKRLDSAEYHQNHLDKYFKLKNIYEALPKQTADLFQHMEKNLGMDISLISPGIDADEVKPVLAQYIYWKNEFSKKSSTLQSLKQQHDNHSLQFPAEREEIIKLRFKIFEAHETELLLKVKASFYLGVLQNPKSTKNFEENIHFSQTIRANFLLEDCLLLGMRHLFQTFGDNSLDNLVKIRQNNGSIRTLTFMEVFQLSEKEIANLLIC